MVTEDPGATSDPGRPQTRESKTAVVVMGVAGSGKTTVAQLLGEQLGWQEAEADDFHPAANVAKMHDGIPLTDEDRAPWLITIRDWINDRPGSVVITCSALKRAYRDVLRTAAADVVFLHLDGSPGLIRKRMSGRTGHFMPVSLLDSQLATLEDLEPDERGVVVNIDQTPEEIVARARKELGL